MFAVILLLIEQPSWQLLGITVGEYMAYICTIMTIWSGVDYVLSSKHVLNYIMGKETSNDN